MLHYDTCRGCGRTALCSNDGCTEDLCPECQADAERTLAELDDEPETEDA